jgi:outer membrane receptor protein involved in Fe transport
VAVWVLYSDSELVFVGDAGSTEPSRPSRREGIEFTNFYTPFDWLTLDADYSLSRARFTESAPEGNYIPGSIEQVVAAGITVHDPNPNRGAFASLRMRYFGSRTLIEDDSVRSGDSTIFNAEVGYRFNPDLTLKVEILNLFDREVSDIDYYYASRLGGEPVGPDDGGFNDVHTHPAEPLTVRAGVTYRF